MRTQLRENPRKHRPKSKAAYIEDCIVRATRIFRSYPVEVVEMILVVDHRGTQVHVMRQLGRCL